VKVERHRVYVDLFETRLKQSEKPIIKNRPAEHCVVQRYVSTVNGNYLPSECDNGDCIGVVR
jgi:hypothetical protein